MNKMNTVMSLFATAILLTAVFCTMFLTDSQSETNSIPNSTNLDGSWGLTDRTVAGDTSVSYNEKDGCLVYTIESFYEYSSDGGLESVFAEKVQSEKIKVETELRVPEKIIGKSDAKFMIYGENEEIETLEIEAVSTIAPDGEIDVIMFSDGGSYSARQIVSGGYMEECVLQFVLLGIGALELLGIVVFAMIAVSYVLISSDSTGWEFRYDIRAGDGSETSLGIAIDKVNRRAKIGTGNWDYMVLANMSFYDSADNEEGLYRLAAIIDDVVYVTNLTINLDMAKCIVKADRSSLSKGTDIYTKKDSDSEEAAKGKSGSCVRHVAHSGNTGIYYPHYHATKVERGNVRVCSVHVFFGTPVIVL
ncbi:MAG: hypothetical protein LBJ20_06440 [Candidatus Methanoplasma sp.]|jgi:hypothetical protein|nr:hypothetical protein [Candidatus Methanoplasma sp.]